MRTRLVGSLLVVLGAASLGAAQAPPATVPAAPDTAVARLSWADGSPGPRTLVVTPAAAALGDVVAIVLDHAPGVLPPPLDSLRVDVDWLEPAIDAPLPDVASLPAAAGARQIAPFRIYRLGAWRPVWDGGPSGPLATVAGRLTDPQVRADVRDPRAVGGVPRWQMALVGGLLAALAGFVLWRRWRRRGGARFAPDQPLAPPAWLAAAIDLRNLERDGTGGAADGRAYLDRLASIVRRYVHGRYHLPAEEMTAAEISAAAARRGWPPAALRSFVTLLAECDRVRYAPVAVSALQCRECLGDALDLIEDARVMPAWSPVAGTTLAEAEAAWRELRARLPRRASERQDSPC
ncbi:MAG TPA: hypothetical protein PLL30_05420 [Candidatus Krumholzibacteria bacterium]|nr:hypothetical protein [Candidatus Krumholzibacteria bacterium]HPD71201.1 hypothetical protein [Candidatus Krumholzibacteria bacterium]HRY39099.1 hypothetical protein [Candidatus Krumholzibacteria bacterium]